MEKQLIIGIGGATVIKITPPAYDYWPAPNYRVAQRWIEEMTARGTEAGLSSGGPTGVQVRVRVN